MTTEIMMCLAFDGSRRRGSNPVFGDKVHESNSFILRKDRLARQATGFYPKSATTCPYTGRVVTLKLHSLLQKPGLTEGTFSYQQRRKRILVLMTLLAQRKGLRILDLGGTREFWIANGKFLPDGTISSIDLVNQAFDGDSNQTDINFQIRSHLGDIRSLAAIPNRNFDLVFSNSAIEHVGNLRDQLAVSKVVHSAGEYHFLQTPARRFPIEPHFHVPLFQFLPLGLKTLLYQRFQCGFMGREPDWLEARIACENTRLLGHRELELLFPQSRILAERVLGLVKSWMVTNLPEPVERDQRRTTPS